MGLYFNFPQGWWVITVIFYGLFAVLFIQRGSYKKKGELKTQIIFGVCTLVLAIVVENVGIRTSLWTYSPGNWPVILWVNYFGSGLVGYQILKKIEEYFQKR